MDLEPRARAHYPHLPAMLDAQLLEALPAAVYVCDLDGVVVRYNKRAAELWGRSPIPGDANELYCGAHRLYLPDGQPMPHNQTPMVDAMRSGASYRNIDVQISRLRKKLVDAGFPEDGIKTVRNAGYILALPVDDAP